MIISGLNKAMIFFVGLAAGVLHPDTMCGQTTKGPGSTLVGTFAGIIVQIQGRADLKLSSTAKPIPLDPKKDTGRVLHLGEILLCHENALLRIRRQDGSPKDISERDGEVPLLPMNFSRQNLKAKALEAYAYRMGDERALKRRIFSPADEGNVRPADLIFRWAASRTARTVDMVLEDENGGVLWRQQGIDGKMGMLQSDDAKKALIAYRHNGGHGRLQLTLIGPDVSTVHFYLLTMDSERELDDELGRWEQETTGIVRHVCRAYSFARYRLLAQIADEYDEAVKSAPESRDLLQAAIQAQNLVGNTEKAAELSRQLAYPRQQP